MRFIYSIIILLATLSGFAQTSPRIYTVRDGLAGNWIIRVMQDSRGFIWSGGDNGLSRFDGKNFINYSINDGLISNHVSGIAEAPDKRLWIATNTGISCFFNNTFTNYGPSKGLPATRIMHIQFDQRNRLWALCSSNIWYLENDSFVRLPVPREIEDVGIHTFYLDGDIVLIGTRKGLYYEKNGKYTRVTNGESDIPVFSICKDQNSTYWLAGLHMGLFKTNLQTIEQVPLGLAGSDFAYLLKKGRNNKLLISTGNRLVVYNHKILAQYVVEDAAASVMDMLEDREGNLWATTFAGLYKFTALPVQEVTSTEKLMPVVCFDPWRKKVLLSTEDSKIMVTSGGPISLLWKNQIPTQGGSHIHSLYPESDGSIWIGGDVGDWIHVDTNGKVKTYDDSLLYINAPYTIFREDKNHLWIGTANGLLLFDGAKFSGSGQVNGLPVYYIRSIIRLPDGRILCGSNRGMYYLTKGHLTPFEDTTLTGVYVYGLAATGNTLFAGTSGFGVKQYELNKAGKFEVKRSFTRKNGLVSDFVEHCLLDKYGVLWLLQGASIGRIELMKDGSAHISNYNEEDGVINRLWSQTSMTLDDNDILWVGTSSGLMTVNTRIHLKNLKKPEVYILQVNLLNNPNAGTPHNSGLDKNGLPLNLELPYRNNSIQFEFTGLCFTNPAKVLYKYRLLGIENDWSEPSPSRSAYFHTLAPGQYTFEVLACNNDGVWATQPATFTFSIRAPFWMTWWFRLSLVMLLPMVVTLVFRRRINKIKKEEERKTQLNKQLAELEMKALRAQMNPHFIFNALNSIQECIVSENYESAYKYLSKFSRLLRLILEVSENNYSTIDREIEMLKLYLQLEELRFENQFDFDIQIDEELDAAHVQVPTMLLQPYVENALWHGLMHKEGKRELMISIRDKEDHILITIEDNGIGRARAAELKKNSRSDHKSKGLSINSERIVLFNLDKERKSKVTTFDLEDENDNATGTRVEIQIPVNLKP